MGYVFKACRKKTRRTCWKTYPTEDKNLLAGPLLSHSLQQHPHPGDAAAAINSAMRPAAAAASPPARSTSRAAT